MHSPCPDPAALDRLARDAADPTEAQVLRDHLAACPLCRAAACARPGGRTLSAPSAPDAPAVPVDEVIQVGGYQVVRIIGQGGMGIVLEAEDPRLRRRVAIKLMRAALAVNAVGRERFLREARAAAAVSHDHVVPIFHVGEEGGVPFLVMPLLAGESLEARLRRTERLSVDEAVRVAREVAAGLSAAHECGLIHRDVKPGNIWLEDRGPGQPVRALLLDFGLARGGTEDDTLTQSGMIVGTPGYMSPEQALGQAVDARTDLFSLGAVLYRTLTGAYPGPARPKLVDVPAELARLIRRLLAPQPSDRPTSAAEVERALSRLTAPAPPDRRRLAWLLIPAAGLLALGLTAVLTGWSRDRSPPTDPAGRSGANAELPDRAAAQWAQQVGGRLFVSVEGAVRRVRPSEPLPPGPFRLRGVDLGKYARFRGEGLKALAGVASLELLWLDETTVGNDDLKHLAELTGLRELDLGGTRIADDGLQHLRDLSRLEILGLAGTRVGDDGLTCLTDLRSLTHLAIDGTRVTDAGLDRLIGLPRLAEVSVRKTDVTAHGRKKLQAVLKNCEVRIGPWVHVSRFLRERDPQIDFARPAAPE